MTKEQAALFEELSQRNTSSYPLAYCEKCNCVVFGKISKNNNLYYLCDECGQFVDDPRRDLAPILGSDSNYDPDFRPEVEMSNEDYQSNIIF